MLRSGRSPVRAWSAINFRSSSAADSGEIGWPLFWRISASSALASSSQRLLGYSLLQFGKAGQRFVAFSYPVLRVRRPVEAPSAAAALILNHAIERFDGLIVCLAIQIRLAPLVVELSRSMDRRTLPGRAGPLLAHAGLLPARAFALLAHASLHRPALRTAHPAGQVLRGVEEALGGQRGHGGHRRNRCNGRYRWHGFPRCRSLPLAA